MHRMTLLRHLAGAAAAVLALAGSAAAQPAVFVSDFFNNRILRIDTGGGGEIPPAVTATTALPSAMVAAPDGTLWVANQGSASITRINPFSGAQVGTISLAGQIQAPGGIAFAA